MKDSKSAMDRREFLAAGITAAAVVPGVLMSARTARAEGDQLVTDIEANAPMVTALQYVNESTKEGQNCAGCQLYTAGDGGRGKCQLFPTGVVTDVGWCASYAPKVS